MSINKSADELWQKIYPTTHASRETLVAYVKALSKEVKALPREVRTAQASDGWGRNNFRGDEIINSLIHALAMQDWLNESTAGDLAEILAVAGQIEMHSRNEHLWERLFANIEALRP